MYLSGVVPVHDVFGDGPVEEHGLLGHDAQLSPDPGNVQALDVVIIDFLKKSEMRIGSGNCPTGHSTKLKRFFR